MDRIEITTFPLRSTSHHCPRRTLAPVRTMVRGHPPQSAEGRDLGVRPVAREGTLFLEVESHRPPLPLVHPHPDHGHRCALIAPGWQELPVDRTSHFGQLHVTSLPVQRPRDRHSGSRRMIGFRAASIRSRAAGAAPALGPDAQLSFLCMQNWHVRPHEVRPAGRR